MSRLAHAVYGAPGFEVEKRDMDKAINIEAKQRRARMVRVTRNVWGNYVGYVGGERVDTRGSEYEATQWLSEQLEAGAVLSPQSDILMGAVLAHRERCAGRDEKLASCAADVAILFRTYDRFNWWVDRHFGGVEFICDQQDGYTMNEAFARAADGDTFHYGTPPCIL